MSHANSPFAIIPWLARTRRLSNQKWRVVRKRILARDRYTCGYCGSCNQGLKGDPGYQMHVDHIIPLARGGTNDDANLIACCASCNFHKGTRLGNRSTAREQDGCVA